jgi:hypothetical protein
LILAGSVPLPGFLPANLTLDPDPAAALALTGIYRGAPPGKHRQGSTAREAPPHGRRLRGYVDLVVLGNYRDLFAAIAASAATLTGLLFVAVSVVPRRGGASGLHVIQQVRAAAALMAFSNALAVSLFSLVPGTNAGYPAVVLGIIGIMFTAAGMRSILSSRSTPRQKLRQLELIIVLLLIFGTELASGIAVIADPRDSTPLHAISYALAASLFVGIARAWELVGDRDTGIIASIAILAGRRSGPDGTPAPEVANAPEAGLPGREPDAHQAGEGGE